MKTYECLQLFYLGLVCVDCEFFVVSFSLYFIRTTLVTLSMLFACSDLIFILVDKPEEYHDRKISEHIMKSSGNDIRSYGYGATNKPMNEMSVSSSQGAMAFKNAESSSISLNQRLRQQCRAVERQDHLLSPTILKTYIEYAKKYCHPQLSIQAAKVLQKFYLTLRSKASSSCGGGDGMPVTTRHLESLIRLAQARAKMELRTEVILP